MNQRLALSVLKPRNKAKLRQGRGPSPDATGGLILRGYTRGLTRWKTVAAGKSLGPLNWFSRTPTTRAEARNCDGRREVYYTGRVQGVGFRYTTRAIVQRTAVTGFVENLVDGRVHLVVEGTADMIRRLIADIEAEMDRYIEHADVQIQEATGEFATFDIRH